MSHHSTCFCVYVSVLCGCVFCVTAPLHQCLPRQSRPKCRCGPLLTSTSMTNVHALTATTCRDMSHILRFYPWRWTSCSYQTPHQLQVIMPPTTTPTTKPTTGPTTPPTTTLTATPTTTPTVPPAQAIMPTLVGTSTTHPTNTTTPPLPTSEEGVTSTLENLKGKLEDVLRKWSRGPKLPIPMMPHVNTPTTNNRPPLLPTIAHSPLLPTAKHHSPLLPTPPQRSSPRHSRK